MAAPVPASAPEIDEASDEYVQTDERAFRRRFGFDAHKHRREQVIRLKHEADLTDREIRALNRTRSLEFKGGVAKISAPLFVAAWGRICLAWLFAMMLLAFAQAQQSPQPVATVIWKLIVVLGGLGLFGGAIVHFYIWPRQLLNRVRSQAARQASTTDAADRQDS